jgi:hypothetical protein
MTVLYSYIDSSSSYEITVREIAPDGIVVQLRDMLNSDISTVRLPVEEIPELAYVLMNIAKEIVLPQQRLLT